MFNPTDADQNDRDLSDDEDYHFGQRRQHWIDTMTDEEFYQMIKEARRSNDDVTQEDVPY